MNRPSAARARSERISLVEAACLALLALVPVFFFRGTEEIFEVPKVALLVTGALAIAAFTLGSELAALARGRGAWVKAQARRTQTFPRRDPVGFAVLLYLGSCLVSTLTSPNPGQSVFGAPESTAGLRTAFATAVIYFALRSRRATPESFDRLVFAASLAAAAAAGYGLVQVAGLDPLDWGRTATFGSTLRVFGTMGHPNFLGAYLAMALPLIAHGWRRARGLPSRAVWLLVAVVSLAALAATLSRAAWIGFAAGMTSWPILLLISRSSERAREEKASPRPTGRRRWGFAIAVAALVMATLALGVRSPLRSALGERLHQLVDPRAATTQTRLHIWAAGLRMAATEPIRGVGLDEFGTVFPAHRTPAYWHLEWGATPVKAHNEAIQILATQGLLGAGTALLVVALVALAAWRALHGRLEATRGSAAAATASLIAFAAQDLASFTVVGIGVLSTALAAWLAAAADPAEPATKTAPAGRGVPPWAVVAAAAIAALAFVPLVARPWQAEIAERQSAVSPERSNEQAKWLAAAFAAAPWDARYPARIAFASYRRAQDEPDSTLRRALLTRAHGAAIQATTLEPQSGVYRTNLGEIEVEQKLLVPPAATAVEAERTLRQAIAADTANGQMLDRIGFAFARLGRKDEAHRVALRLAFLYPDLGQPLGLIGLLALDQRRTADGIDTLRLALARDWRGQNAPHASAWSNLAVGYLTVRRYQEARDAAAEALRLDPSLQGARDNLALAESVLRMLGTGRDSAR